MRPTIPRILLVAALAAACWIAVSPAAQQPSGAGAAPPRADSLRAALDARAAGIFGKNCAGACHAGARPKARLSLEPSTIAALADTPSRQIDTLRLVDTKRPARSYLLMKIRGEKGIKGSRMPIGRPPLPSPDEKTVAEWAAGLRAPAPAAAPAKKR